MRIRSSSSYSAPPPRLLQAEGPISRICPHCACWITALSGKRVQFLDWALRFLAQEVASTELARQNATPFTCPTMTADVLAARRAHGKKVDRSMAFKWQNYRVAIRRICCSDPSRERFGNDRPSSAASDPRARFQRLSAAAIRYL